MNWVEAISHFNVPKIYQQCSLNGDILIDPNILNLGHRWLKSRDKPSLYLYGPPGCGKTYFAYCLLRGLIEAQYSWVILVKSDELDSELLRAMLENQEICALAKYKEVPILFIDDIGTERLNDRIMKQYYSIIDHRFTNNLSTIITSNLSNSEIKTTLGERIASRLSMSYEIRFPATDFRKKMELPPL